MPEPRPTPFDDLDGFAVLRARDVADRLGVDARSVRPAIARGELVASRACGLRILAADAAAWWRASRVTPTLRPPEAPAPQRAGAADVDDKTEPVGPRGMADAVEVVGVVRGGGRT